MKKVKVVIIGCGGRGKDTYAKLQKVYANKMEISAIAEPDDTKRLFMHDEYGVPLDRCFKTADELFEQGLLGDLACVCTLDRMHFAQGIRAMKIGYNLLLEKPVSPILQECIDIAKAAKEYNRKVIVCHVLRYTVFYSKIKEIVESGEIGDIISMSAIEPVSYWHQAHSFVRGNFRNSNITSPMILQKCCHDLDILLWMKGNRPKKVSSFGSNTTFKFENKPEGAPERCYDGCPYSETCVYYAPKFYLHELECGDKSWALQVVGENLTKERLINALKTGRYGRCVYQCDNNVVDHQVVNLLFEDGATASLTMCAYTKDSYRKLHIMGTKGEVTGNLETNTIRVETFMGEDKTIDVKTLTDDFSGHAGGDKIMMADVIELITTGKCDSSRLTTLDSSLDSHYAAFAAEESRINYGKCIDIDEFIGK